MQQRYVALSNFDQQGADKYMSDVFKAIDRLEDCSDVTKIGVRCDEFEKNEIYLMIFGTAMLMFEYKRLDQGEEVIIHAIY